MNLAPFSFFGNDNSSGASIKMICNTSIQITEKNIHFTGLKNVYDDFLNLFLRHYTFDWGNNITDEIVKKNGPLYNLVMDKFDKLVDFNYSSKQLQSIFLRNDFEYIINELLHNSFNAHVKANCAGSIDIKIEQILNTIQISITDHGIGIQKINIDDATSAITIMPKSTNKTFNKELLIGGEGLGVNAIQLLVRLHGGIFRYQSFSDKTVAIIELNKNDIIINSNDEIDLLACA